MSSWTWEEQAKQGAPMPERLSLNDQMAYQAMCMLHRRYGRGEITRSQFTLEENQIRRTYARFQERADWDARLAARWAGLWKEMEAAAAAYRAQPSRELADRVMTVIYGMPPVSAGGKEAEPWDS